MKQVSRPLVAAILSAAALGICSNSYADQPASAPQTDTAQELQMLRARIDQLEKQQTDQKVKQDAAFQQATVDSVLKDSAEQSRFFDSAGFSAGWNAPKQQFFVGSEDGNFYLHPGIIFQFRGVGNYRSDPPGSRRGAISQYGFEVRRAKWYFDGNIFSPDVTYKFQWQDNANGAPTLEYGWGQYVFAKHIFGTGDLAIRAGQFKDIVFKEEFTGDQVQLMAERSLANTLVGGNQAPGNLTQGVDFLLLGKEAPLHAEVLLHDGFGSGNTNFAQPHGTTVTFPQVTTDPATNPGYWGAAARADFKVFGDWADTTDFTGMNAGKKNLLDIGGGLDVTDAQGLSALRATVDAQFQIAKTFSLFGAVYGESFHYRKVKAGSATNANNYGGQIEGGYMLTPALQLVGRYSLSHLDNKFKISSVGTFQEYAAGLNWYGPNGAWGNHFKFTVDLNWLPDGTPAAGGLDYLATTKAHDELVLRTQLQVWF